MPIDEFTSEPDPSDVLQVAADAALDAFRAHLASAGVPEDGWSVVITAEREESIATAVFLGRDVEDPDEWAAIVFHTQVLHLGATARTLGVQLRVVPIMGQG